MTQYLSEIEDLYTQNRYFLSRLPNLALYEDIDLNGLNTWLINNQRAVFILDTIVFNILPGILTAGIFHLFYYAFEAIISLISTYVLKETVTFHTNWTDHFTLFKNSKSALSKINKIQEEIENQANQFYISSESINYSDTNDENDESNQSSETLGCGQDNTPDQSPDYLYTLLPEDKYPSVFNFLPLEALGKFAQTSQYNLGLVHNYFSHFDINHIIPLPQNSEQIEQILQFAINHSYFKLFAAIIRQCDKPLVRKYLYPLLIKAAEENNIAFIKIILSIKDPITDNIFFNINFSIPNDNNWEDDSILMIATKNGFSDLMRLCVQHGAKRVRSGRTQLSLAIRSKNLECVKIMLELIALDYDIKNYLNNSRLHGLVAYELNALSEAVDFGTVEIAQLLIDHGADVNHNDERGYPMERALNTLNYEMFILLLKNNYNIAQHESFVSFMIENLRDSGFTNKFQAYIKIAGKIQSSTVYKERKDQSTGIEEFIHTPEAASAIEPDNDKNTVIIWLMKFINLSQNDDHPNIVLARKKILEPLKKETLDETPPTLNAP